MIQKNTSRWTGSQDINTVDDTTINFNDVNRYQRRANISIFRNEFIRIDTRLAFSLFLQISYLILPRVCSLTTLSTTCPATFSGELFIAIPCRDRAPHSVVYTFLRKQFIRLFVFRLGVPRGLFRFLLVPPSVSLPRCRIQRLAHTSKLFSDSTFVEHTTLLNKA